MENLLQSDTVFSFQSGARELLKNDTLQLQLIFKLCYKDFPFNENLYELTYFVVWLSYGKCF